MTETRFPMETRPQLSPGTPSSHPDHSARPPTPSRQEFEAERKPDLRRDVYLQDIHCVSSLCKAYFRELPDPLLTYRLYDKFAVRRGAGAEDRVLSAQVQPGSARQRLSDPERRRRYYSLLVPLPGPSPASPLSPPFPKAADHTQQVGAGGWKALELTW